MVGHNRAEPDPTSRVICACAIVEAPAPAEPADGRHRRALRLSTNSHIVRGADFAVQAISIKKPSQR
jgi:hypothetical protein